MNIRSCKMSGIVFLSRKYALPRVNSGGLSVDVRHTTNRRTHLNLEIALLNCLFNLTYLLLRLLVDK